MQLSALGAENLYFTGNPQMSFFKFVYKRFTNFSMEDIPVYAESTNDSLSFSKTTKFRFKLPRNADLVSKMYLRLNLPRIVSSKEDQFYWIQSVGTHLLDFAELYVGGYKIETIRGDLLYLQNQLYRSKSQKELFDALVGNKPHMNVESHGQYEYVGHSSQSTDSSDLSGIQTLAKEYNTPSFIREQVLYIPLNYWFTKNYGLSLPLIALQYHQVELEVQFRPVQELYTIMKPDKTYYYYTKAPTVNDWAKDYGSSVTPLNKIKKIRKDQSVAGNVAVYKSRVRSAPTAAEPISKYLVSSVAGFENSEPSWNLRLELMVKYIFLDSDERKLFSKQEHTFLVEQNRVFEEYGLLESANIKFSDLFHPCKNIIFTIQRNDVAETNSFHNFSTLPQIGPNRDAFEYQNNWWYNSVASENTSVEIHNPETNQLETIVCDRFQEFLFRFGPFGEAGVFDPNTGNSVLGFKKQDHEDLYTMDQCRDFRENIWMYLPASQIPVIDNSNQEAFSSSPLKQCRMLFNGQIREDDHDHVYYTDVRNYEFYHSASDHPIYSYSFSLFPSKYIPTGICNMSRVNFLEFLMSLNYPRKQAASAQSITYDWDYTIRFYFISYNFFKIQSGLGGLMFAN